MPSSAYLGRYMLGLYLLTAGWLTTPPAAAGEEPTPPKKIRVFFVGNSQIYFNDLPRTLEALSESAAKERPRIQTDRAVYGGATLESHWNKGDGKDTARGKIAQANCDYVIFQEYSSVASPVSFARHSRLFTELIRKHGAKPILLSTSHIFSRYPKGFHEVHEMNMTVAKEFKVPVAAAGYSWLAYWGESPSEKDRLDLFHADKGHPGLNGSYIYACTLYALITGQSPVGLTNRLPSQPEDAITPAQAKRFQEAAWQVHQKLHGMP